MLIVTIILTILALDLAKWANKNKHEEIGCLSSFGCIFLGALDTVIVVFIIGYFFAGFTVSDKIKMYQEENRNIEEQLTIIVNNYQGYEQEVISNIADMEVLVIKYPELKSSDLVNTQIKLYIVNNDKIKELKEEEIDLKIGKWLLYFGK